MTDFEIDLDVGTSSMANRILSMVKSYIKTLKMDLAFVIEGQAPSELPEQVLGCVRLQFIDMDELNAWGQTI